LSNIKILSNLAKASEILTKANILTAQYEQELTRIRKEAQLEITNSQKVHQEILEIELNISQKYIDNLLRTIITDLNSKKNLALNSLDNIVKSLCLEIENKLSEMIILNELEGGQDIEISANSKGLVFKVKVREKVAVY
jgi:F0F1-type ATP synthase membrane subunit b/b'